MYKEYPTFRPEEVLEYGRKSQFDDPLLTVEEQLEKHEKILDEYAIRHFGGSIPAANKYKEIGSGETLKNRIEINKVLRRIERPEIKGVLVVDVQRLSRGSLKDAGKLIELFQYSNTYVITPTKIYDIRDEYDREAFERELKRGHEYLEYYKKIQARGKLASVREGNFVGSVAPFGFDRVKKPYPDGKRHYWTLKEKPEEAGIVRGIFDWYCNEGLSASNICRRLGQMGIRTKSGKMKWSPMMIEKILGNVHYIGKVRWNWRKVIKIIKDQEVKVLRPQAKVGEYLVFEGKHDGLISEELYNRAQEISGSAPRKQLDLALRNALAGIIFCKCGYALVHTSFKPRPTPPKLKCTYQRICKSGSVDYQEIMDRVCSSIREAIENFEIRVINDQSDSAKLHKSLIASLERKLKNLKDKEVLQWQAQTDPNPDKRMPPEIFKTLNEKLLVEKAELEDALSEAYESLPEPIDYKEKIIKFTEVLEAVENPDVSVEDKNRYLKDIIKRIEYERESNIMVTSNNYKELGMPKPTRGMEWYAPPFKIDVYLK